MKNFIKQYKYHLVILVILILITLISGRYLLITNHQINTTANKQTSIIDQKNIKTDKQLTNSETSTKSITLNETKDFSDKILDKQKNSLNTSPNNNTAKQPHTSTVSMPNIITFCKQNCLNTQIKINTTTYHLQLQTDITVYSAMNILQQNSSFNFKGKKYTSLGFFVNEINGIKNNIKNNQYWIYYVNGQSAKVGISNYKLNNNDLIEWKYEKSNF